MGAFLYRGERALSLTSWNQRRRNAAAMLRMQEEAKAAEEAEKAKAAEEAEKAKAAEEAEKPQAKRGKKNADAGADSGS